jgi:IclR family transcriptional regulator, KDG regulon repressor
MPRRQDREMDKTGSTRRGTDETKGRGNSPREVLVDNSKGESEAAQVQSVAVAVRILTEMAEEARMVRVTEIANRLGMTKARVSRHFATLAELGLVERVEGEGFRLSWAIYRMGQAVVDQNKIAEVAHPYLAALRDATGETTVLSLPSDQGGVITLVFEGRRDLFVSFRLGAVLPYHLTATGRVLLAFAAPATQSRVTSTWADAGLSQSAQLVLQRRLQLIRKNFYESEAEKGPFHINVLAAPTFDHSDALSGAISVLSAGRATSDTPDRALVQRTLQCARELSEAMGCRRWPTVGS